ncbi:MAG: hypothetical protein K5989_11965, partial [Lachnospiraceae bacterium]|nr:hypothetical protein [Lachnospiraceae bacterium]
RKAFSGTESKSPNIPNILSTNSKEIAPWKRGQKPPHPDSYVNQFRKSQLPRTESKIIRNP